MPLVSTDAIVLHAFDYSETSRIVRLMTREAGLRSVLARGARRSVKRFGSGFDLFAGGVAHIVEKNGRDLQTLAAFDVTRGRPALAGSLGRFTGASALAEISLRFASDEANPGLFDSLAFALDDIAAAAAEDAREAALAGAWRLVAELGFAPSLASCSECHAEVPNDSESSFSHEAGGVLCSRCARTYPGCRSLPADARRRVGEWLTTGWRGALADREGRAHQRLLREFLHYHLADGRTMRAFEVWEHAPWSSP